MEVNKKIIYLHLLVRIVALSIVLIYGIASLLIFTRFLEAHPANELLHRILEIAPFGASPTNSDVIIRWAIIVSIVYILFVTYVTSLFVVLAISFMLQAVIFKLFINKEDMKLIFVSSYKMFCFMEGNLFPFVGRTYELLLSLIIGNGKPEP